MSTDSSTSTALMEFYFVIVIFLNRSQLTYILNSFIWCSLLQVFCEYRRLLENNLTKGFLVTFVISGSNLAMHILRLAVVCRLCSLSFSQAAV